MSSLSVSRSQCGRSACSEDVDTDVLRLVVTGRTSLSIRF